MASKLTPAGMMAKWLLAPIAVGLVGYFVIGPRIGTSGTAAKPSADEPKNASTAPEKHDPPPVESSQPSVATNSGPDVDVQVQKVTPTDTEVAAATPRPRHAHRHHTVAPVAPASTPPTVKAPPTDEGGSAGSTTAG